MEVTKKQMLLQAFKSAVVSLFFFCIGVLVLAVVCKLTNLGHQFLPAINQAVKVVSLFFALVTGIKGNAYLFKCLLASFLFWILSLVLFVILGGQIKIGTTALDLLICLVVGTIIAVVKSKRA